MARLSCASCGTEVAAYEDYCFGCGAVLSAPGAKVERTPVEDDQAFEDHEDREGGPGPEVAAEDCPACGERLTRAGDRICMSCGHEIVAERSAPERALGLVVTFATGPLRVAPGEELPLGRDPAYASAPTLSRFDNVSRRHATVIVDPAGVGWVRDDRSTNGTFVDDQPVPPGDRVALPNGARLRLASDVVATVQHIPEPDR